MASKVVIPREIKTVDGSTISAGIIGCTNLWSFAMQGGKSSGLEVVCVRGKKRAARVAARLAASSGDFRALRAAAIEAKNAPSKPEPTKCPECGRSLAACWTMPCFHLDNLLASENADQVNAWLEKIGAPIRVELKA